MRLGSLRAKYREEYALLGPERDGKPYEQPEVPG
jgi:hypothetical protein